MPRGSHAWREAHTKGDTCTQRETHAHRGRHMTHRDAQKETHTRRGKHDTLRGRHMAHTHEGACAHTYIHVHTHMKGRAQVHSRMHPCTHPKHARACTHTHALTHNTKANTPYDKQQDILLYSYRKKCFHRDNGGRTRYGDITVMGGDGSEDPTGIYSVFDGYVKARNVLELSY